MKFWYMEGGGTYFYLDLAIYWGKYLKLFNTSEAKISEVSLLKPIVH